jgi:hypothetical protein
MGMVLWGSLAWHPAAAAWRAVAPTAPNPDCIEVLRSKNGSAVYRLVGAGPSGGPIIARRSGKTTALIVRALYEKMLSRLPITLPRYRAFCADGPEYAWVFLEDVGGNDRR